jgi:hypothetical protein
MTCIYGCCPGAKHYVDSYPDSKALVNAAKEVIALARRHQDPELMAALEKMWAEIRRIEEY